MNTAAIATSGPTDADLPPARLYWREAVARYERPSVRHSLLDLATSVVPYLVLTVTMYVSLQVSVWISLALAVPAAGFLMRTFIVFHDCAHGSFLPNRRANLWVGRFAGLLVFQPFANWRHNHAVHHGSSGDLDRRGTGDIATLTVDEYLARPWKSRLGYRLFRSPVVMFGIGPIWSLMIGPRLWSSRMRPRQRRSVIVTNIVLAIVIAAIISIVGLQGWLLVQMPTAILAGTLGVFMFYVQHQFEDVYWETSDRWSYADAALQGSSYLKLPKLFQFFTGNIGLHHVHHLSAKIPNYNLQRAHDESPIFHDVPVLSVGDALRAVRLKVIDRQNGRLLTWREVKALGARASRRTRGRRRGRPGNRRRVRSGPQGGRDDRDDPCPGERPGPPCGGRVIWRVRPATAWSRLAPDRTEVCATALRPWP